MSLMGIDVGTTGCKVLVLAEGGEILATAHREYNVIRPRPEWAELDSQQVWDLICDAIREATAQTRHDPVIALSVSSMGEAMTPVSKERQILGRCILGFDPRGAETLAKLSALDTVAYYEQSGNLASGVFGGPKLIWMRDHWPELFERTYKFLNWADLVAYLLGGEPITDFSLANRSLFFDLRREQWAPDILDYVGMPREKLPEAVQAGTVVGRVTPALAADLGLAPGALIVIGAHDQCSTATGAGCTRAGMASYGLGTYICIAPIYDAIPSAQQMIAARLNVEHHALPGLYISFLYNLTGGALLKWFRDTLAPLEHAAARAEGADVYDRLLAEMPSEPTDLLVLPHFAPTGPPYYDENARGMIAGLTLATTRGALIKGLLEGVTYYYRHGLEYVERAGIRVDEFRVTGGGARSDAWLQIKADILGRPLARVAVTEAGALGAAILAGVGGGVYASAAEAMQVLVRVERVFEPMPAHQPLYDERFARYKQLYPFMQTLY